MTTLDLKNDIINSVKLIVEDIDQNLQKKDFIGFYELFEFVKNIIHYIFDIQDDLIVFETVQDLLLKDKCEEQNTEEEETLDDFISNENS